MLWLMLVVSLVQIFVLNHICLWGYASPLLGCVALYYVPLATNRIYTMLGAFLMGLLLDAFSNTPGLSAAALTLTAFVQQPLLRLMTSEDVVQTEVPDMKMLGRYKYFFYMALLMAVYQVTYFLLEAFSFFNLTDLLLRLLSSYILSLLLAFVAEAWRSPHEAEH